MITALALLACSAVGLTMDDLVKAVDSKRLRATVEHLASFHTRNTLSPGNAESAAWVASELKNIPGVEVEVMSYLIAKGRRVPEDTTAVQVVAKIPGADDRVILIGAHLDSLNLSVDAKTGRAPGANDDASGVAAVMELVRILSTRKWQHTLIFVAFSGEEQGLLGSRALARRAKADGWKLDAVLSNDTVGSSKNKSGQSDSKRVRVFSDEGTSENPHNSRELARYVEWIVRHKMKDFGIKLVLRKDRFGRGGDHTPFAEEGYSAIRFIEVHEEFTRQHTPDDLPEHMDWAYLAKVAGANLVAMATLAEAGEAPTNVRIKLDQNHDTTVTWKAVAGQKYVVYWRDTASAEWQGSKEVGAVGEATIKGINKDDHFFAVGAENGIPVAVR